MVFHGICDEKFFINGQINCSLMKGIFLIFLCIKISFSGTYAIDFGSNFVKSSFTKSNEVPTVILNSQSKRSTPAFVAFHAKSSFDLSNPSPLTEDETELLDPEIGEKAQSLIKFKSRIGSGFFTSFAGLDDHELDELSHLLFVNSNPARLSINDLLPLFFKKYLAMISSKSPMNRLTLAFPATYSMSQRSLFEESLNICGFNASKLNITFVDDVDAIIHIYAIEKSFKFQKKERNVLFLDIGAASIKGYVVNFQNKIINQTKYPFATRLSYIIDHKNGGAFVTGSIVQNIKERLNIKKTTDAEDRRLFEAAEKIKIDLSKSNSSIVIIQDINGRDFDITFTREELELQVMASTIAQAVIDVAKQATNNIDFDDIELIGGSSRIPIIERALTKVFKNVQKIGHALNPDEAIAIGSNYYTQQIFNISKFKKVTIIDNATIYSIDMLTNDETISICKKNVGCIDTINISGSVDTINIVYSQDDELQEGLSSNSQSYDLETIKNGTLSFKFSHHPTKIKSLIRCKVKSCWPATYTLLNPPPILKDVIILFIDPKVKKERIMAAQKEVQDYAKLKLDEINKNATVRFFTNHSQRLEMIRCIEKERVWASKDNKAISMRDLKNITGRIKNIKKCMRPVYHRIEENTSYVYAIRELYLSLESASQILAEVKYYKPPGLDKNAKITLKQKFKKIEEWFNESVRVFQEIPPYLDRPIKPKDFKDKAVELTMEVERFRKVLNELRENASNNGDGHSSDSHSRVSKSEYEKAEAELRKEVNKMKKVNFIYGPKKNFIHETYDDL